MSEQEKQRIKAAIDQAIDYVVSPPKLRENIKLAMEVLKETFPELEALKKPMRKLPDEISIEWFFLLPPYEWWRKIERMFKKKQHEEALAYLALLAVKLKVYE